MATIIDSFLLQIDIIFKEKQGKKNKTLLPFFYCKEESSTVFKEDASQNPLSSGRELILLPSHSEISHFPQSQAPRKGCAGPESPQETGRRDEPAQIPGHSTR